MIRIFLRSLSNSSCLITIVSLLFIPELQGEAGTDTGPWFCYWFLLLILFHCCLHHPSPFSLSLALVIPFPPTPAKSLFTQSISVLLFLFFYTLNCSSSNIFTCSAHFEQLLSPTPTSFLSFSVLCVSTLYTPTILLTQIFANRFLLINFLYISNVFSRTRCILATVCHVIVSTSLQVFSETSHTSLYRCMRHPCILFPG